METAVWVGIIAAVGAVIGAWLAFSGAKRGHRAALVDKKLTHQFAQLDEKEDELTEAYREVMSKWALKTSAERVGALEILAVCRGASKPLREAALALKDSQLRGDDGDVRDKMNAVREAYDHSQALIDIRREELLDFLRRQGKAGTAR